MVNQIVVSPIKSISIIRAIIPKRFYSLIMHFVAFLLFIGCFITTVLVFFPKDDLRRPLLTLIQQQTGLDISVGELSLSPLLNIEVKEIAWQPTLKNWPPLEVESFSLSPVWTTLLGRNPAGRFHVSIAGGTVRGRIAKDGSGKALLAGLQLGSIVPSQFSFSPKGTLGGAIEVAKLVGANLGPTDFDFVVDDLRVGGLVGLGLPANELSLGRLRLHGKTTGKTFTLEGLQNEDGDLSLTGHGTILINKRLERCRLNLQIEMRLGGKLGPEFQQLLLFSGHKAGEDGSYKFRFFGTLAQPIVR